MKRKIKFRAWDGKQMIYSKDFDNINFRVDGTVFRIWTNNEEYILLDYSKELTQFTGLKDKNGKEIYEGDICRITNSWTTFNRQCEFIDSSFGFRGTNGTFFPNAELMEIVGNIYENPELLKP